ERKRVGRRRAVAAESVVGLRKKPDHHLTSADQASISKLSNCVALCRPASSCTFLMCCCVWRRGRSGCGGSPRRFTASSGTASCRASASVAWCASGRRTWRCSVRVITVRERPRIPAWLHARHLHALGRGELTVPDVRLAPAVLDDVLAFARAFGLGLY